MFSALFKFDCLIKSCGGFPDSSLSSVENLPVLKFANTGLTCLRATLHWHFQWVVLRCYGNAFAIPGTGLG